MKLFHVLLCYILFVKVEITDGTLHVLGSELTVGAFSVETAGADVIAAGLGGVALAIGVHYRQEGHFPAWGLLLLGFAFAILLAMFAVHHRWGRR